MKRNKLIASALCASTLVTPMIPAVASEVNNGSQYLVEAENAIKDAKETNEISDEKEETTIKLRVGAVTDTHTYLMNYDYYTNSPSDSYGLNKVATLIKSAKEEADQDGDLTNDIDNMLLVDNGDTIQGTLLGDYHSPRVSPLESGHPSYIALDYLGFDASTLGNHEFNYGLDFLDSVLKTTNLSVVNSNVYNMKGEHAFNPYKIIEETVVDSNGEEQTLKIGVCGFVPPQILTWDGLILQGKVEVKDIYESAVETVNILKNEENCDLVIALAHTGYGDEEYTPGEENQGYQLSTIEGIDLLVNGHSHEMFPGDYKSINSLENVDVEKGTINGTATMLPGSFGKFLGVADLTLKQVDGKWEVVDSQTELRSVDKSVEPDEGFNELMKEYHENTVKYANSSIGKINSDVNTFFSLVGDSNAVELVANAQIEYAKKLISTQDNLTQYKDMPLLSLAAPFKAGSSADNYTNIEAGEFKIYNAADLYKYSNTVVLAKLTGAEIKEFLEAVSDVFNEIDPNSSEEQELINPDFRAYNFDSIEGLTYEIDVTKPSKYKLVDGKVQLVNSDAERVVNLKYQGKEVTPDQEFMVVTNNYRAGSSFFGTAADGCVVYEDSAETRAIIADYIRNRKVTKVTLNNNWKIKTIEDSNADITFTSNSKAVKYLGKKSPVSVDSVLENGLTKFKYDLSSEGYVCDNASASTSSNGGSSSSNKHTSDSDTAVKDEVTKDEVTNVKEHEWIQNADGSWSLNKKGQAVKGWQKVEDSWFFINEDGKMHTGWKKLDDTWFYLNNNGTMHKGWLKDSSNKWYYLNEDGSMKKGWLKSGDNNWYFLNESGDMATGWIKDNNKWYHLSENGAMSTGWLKDTDGNWYYLKNNGEMACNESIDGYYVGSNGAWVK